MSYLDESGNLRADPGGEVGVIGEFYKGGQFIATHEDRVKGADPRRVATPEQVAYAKEQDRLRDEERATRKDRAKANVPVLVALFGEEWKREVKEIARLGNLRFTSSDGFSGTNFYLNHVADLLNGRNPGKWSPRRIEILLEIHGKRFGRKGSKAYRSAYANLEKALTDYQ